MVTLCEHALWQLGSHRSFRRADYGGLARPAVAVTTALQRVAGQEPPSHPPPAGVPFPPPPPAHPPTQVTQGRVAFRPGLARPERNETRSGFFPQRNPSAADRALVLITPHPLAAGVTSATRALSSSFQKCRHPKPATHIWRALQPPAPPLVVAAAETATAAAGRTATPLCGGLTEVLPSSPSPPRLRPFRPRAGQEGELFSRGLKPEAAFLAEGPVGEEQVEGNVG